LWQDLSFFRAKVVLPEPVGAFTTQEKGSSNILVLLAAWNKGNLALSIHICPDI
jgi:hypothetical protein